MDTGRTEILRASLGIGLYAGAFGMSFGAFAAASGFTLAQSSVLSLVMFSGASQYAFVGVAAAGSPWAAVAAALLLGVRNSFYGVPMSEILRPRGFRRWTSAHFVIDETTAMAVAQPSRETQRYAFWSTAIVLFVLWQAGTVIGALVGRAIDPSALGLDAAAPVAFLALLWPRLRDTATRLVGVAGAVVAGVLVPVAPAGIPVIAAAGVALIAGLRPAREAR